MHNWNRRLLMSRVIDGDWSPRAILHGFVQHARKMGATMVMLGEMMEIRKQAVSQWTRPVEQPASHIERHALDHLLRLASIPDGDVPEILKSTMAILHGLLQRLAAMEPVGGWPEDTILDEGKFVTIQIWASDEIGRKVRDVAKPNFGCKKNFYFWVVQKFVENAPYQHSGFVFRQPRMMKKHQVSGGILYVQIPEEWNLRYRALAEELEVSYNAFLLAAIEWGLKCFIKTEATS